MDVTESCCYEMSNIDFSSLASEGFILPANISLSCRRRNAPSNSSFSSSVSGSTAAMAVPRGFADAARRGSSVEGCVAYVTHYPCINCVKIMAAAGIAEVRYRQDYNNDPLVAPLMADAGIKILQL